jgi:hypothetical protein
MTSFPIEVKMQQPQILCQYLVTADNRIKRHGLARKRVKTATSNACVFSYSTTKVNQLNLVWKM